VRQPDGVRCPAADIGLVQVVGGDGQFQRPGDLGMQSGGLLLPLLD
jgi:hypothetical protein